MMMISDKPIDMGAKNEAYVDDKSHKKARLERAKMLKKKALRMHKIKKIKEETLKKVEEKKARLERAKMLKKKALRMQKIKKNKEETLKNVEETEEWNPSDHEVKK